MVNLHLTYQSARLWHPPSLSYFAFFSDLFVSCLLTIQIQKRSYSFLDRIVSLPNNDEDKEYMNEVPYFSVVKSLMYVMVCTILDLAHVRMWLIDLWVILGRLAGRL